MQYIHARQRDTVDFRTALLSGLADDGGLYVPTAVPTFSQQGYCQLVVVAVRRTGGGYGAVVGDAR